LYLFLILHAESILLLMFPDLLGSLKHFAFFLFYFEIPLIHLIEHRRLMALVCIYSFILWGLNVCLYEHFRGYWIDRVELPLWFKIIY